MPSALQHTIPGSYTVFNASIRGMSAERGGRLVFEDLKLSMSNGDLISLIGANGSGKSTLLRTIAGLIKGSLEASGDQFETNDFSQSFIYLGHEKGLKLGLTLKENCRFWFQSMIGHRLNEDNYQKCLSQLSISHLSEQPVKYFSSGQRQRSALMRFLLLPKPIWLMDEPMVGLDSDSKQVLNDMIKQHRGSGGAAIVATHDALDEPSQVLSLDDFQPSVNNKSFWT